MDHTFGGHELLESLSQASTSAKSRQSKDSRRSKGSGGSSSSTLTSAHTNPVEDAYRRIGQGLSQRAQGSLDDQRSWREHAPHARSKLGNHPATSFQRYQRPPKKPFNPHDVIGGHPHPTQGGPSPKIAKLGGRFQDPGVDPNKPSQKILKRITLQAKETFHKWRRQQKAGYLNKYAQHQSVGSLPGTLSTSASSATSYGPGSGPASLDKYGRLTEQQLLLQQQQSMSLPHDPTAPQRYGLSQIAMQQAEQQQQLNASQHTQQAQGGAKGLLSAVLEGGSDSAYESESVHSLPTINSQKTGMSKSSRTGQNAYHQYPGPSSLSGGSSSGMLGSSLMRGSLPRHEEQVSPSMGGGVDAQPSLHYATPRGRCLTQPAEPVGNEGLDNVEGNMILFQNDILIVPARSNAQPTPNMNKGKPNTKGLEFHVQSLLGQGTFAQVFCCWESVSKKHVALKVIKNKPAFTKQAAVEIEVFQALAAKSTSTPSAPGAKPPEQPEEDDVSQVGGSTPASPHMVHLLSSFMYKNHLCLVFEKLGLNLYEVLKRRQFRGLPLHMVRTLVRQAIEGVKELAGKTIVHCDLKPENILLVGEEVEKDVVGAGESSGKQQQPISGSSTEPTSSSASVTSLASSAPVAAPQTIKLIDFGSACFEGYSAHTYIQSRFYRSPEVLMGLPYDSAIDMWSLGCVAAELFLGLPILPGVHEHDQCGRICEMIGEIPDWMLEQGSKAPKYYVKYVPRHTNNTNTSASTQSSGGSSGSTAGQTNTATSGVGQSSSTDTNHRPMLPQWRLKSQEEYIKSLSQNEIRKKGGLAKLEKQPTNRYFKRTKLSDIILLHGQHCVGDDKEVLAMFVHFLYGLLDPDPWKRWTAYQASQHPFVTGMTGQMKKKTKETKLDLKEENHANRGFDVYWQPPWDPGICRRKLLNVQRMREKQNAQRRGFSQPRTSHGLESQDARSKQQPSPSMSSVNSRGQPMMVADSPSVGHMSVDGKSSPPSQIASNKMLRAGRGMNMLKGGTASSLSAIGHSGLSTALGTENPIRSEHMMNTPSNKSQPMFAGPQSYTGLGFEDAPGDADFSYALQRPGNVPGLGSDAATVASNASLGSSHAGASVSSGQPHAMHQQQHPSHRQSYSGRMHHQNSVSRYSTAGGQASSVNSLPNAAGYPNQSGMMMGAGGVSYQSYGNSSGLNQGGVQYLAQQQQLQKQRAREQQQQKQQQQQQPQQSSMDQVPPHMMSAEYHHQLLIQEQQKQMAALQQQHQQQLAALQQQQQLAFQQQQQQFLSQQQYGTTGNGYYYVTSADGTPMLMQGGAGGAPPMGSYDGSAAGSSYGVMPPQNIGGGVSRSHRDGRSGGGLGRQMRGSRRGGGDAYRGGPGMSM